MNYVYLVARIVVPLMNASCRVEVEQAHACDAARNHIRSIVRVIDPLDNQLDEVLLAANSEIVLSSRSKKIIVSRLCDIIRKHAARRLFGSECRFNPLPDTVSGLEWKSLLKMYYLQLEEQTNGWTCGPWAVFNARALSSLIQEGAIISNESITERARRFYDEEPGINGCVDYVASLYVPDKGPKMGEDFDPGHLTRLAKWDRFQLLGAIHVIGFFYPDNDTVYYEQELESDAISRDLGAPLEQIDRGNYSREWYQQQAERLILAELRKDAPLVQHFICHLKITQPPLPDVFHYILVSLVKLAGKQPALVILDSYNFEITPSDDASKLIAHIERTYLAPLLEEVIPQELPGNVEQVEVEL